MQAPNKEGPPWTHLLIAVLIAGYWSSGLLAVAIRDRNTRVGNPE